MEMSKTKLSWLIFTLLIILAIANVSSYPEVASEYYGTATKNWSDAEIGANITAYDPNGILCGYFIVSELGYYGSLSCNGDDEDTDIDEGSEENDNITFYVDGERAVMFGNKSWERGMYKELNISAQNYTPTFDHGFDYLYINESTRFLLDVNCTDLNYWENVTYYDNTSLFDIDIDTGLIDWTPTNTHVGNHSVTITCGDNQSNTSDSFGITVYDVNIAPVLIAIGNKVAAEGEKFTYYVNATDADNDTLVYSTNTTLFTINNLTGLISFTPSISQIGNYSINISVSDGPLSDYEVISFRIVRGPYCGDGSCGSTEYCSSCPQDCGDCPSVEEDAAAAATADKTRKRIRRMFAVCSERWECSEWSECSIDNYQIRECIDINKCGTQLRKPAVIKDCVYEGSCFDGIQNCHGGACEEGIDCGGICKPCVSEASCSDGIQNCHDGECEEGIDCGGTCKPCEIKRYAKIPLDLEKLAPIANKYPWLLVLLMTAIMSLTFAGDRTYVHRITKKEFEEYRKRMRKYKKIRWKIYGAAIILSSLLFAISFYIYLLGHKENVMFLYIWGTLGVTVLGLIATPFILSKLRYHEYKKQKKEKRFLEKHRRKRDNFVRMEDDILTKLELKMGKKVYDGIKSSDFDKELMDLFKSIYGIVFDLSKKRKEKSRRLETSKEIKDMVSVLSSDIILENISKEHPQLKDVLDSIRKLNKEFTKKKTNKEKEEYLIEDMVISVTGVASDSHLMTVIKSDEKLVTLYNEIVDVFKHYKDQIESKEKIEKEITQKESEFRKKIEEITKNPVTIEKVKMENKLVSWYNSLVDLYNHYKKKSEIMEKRGG